MMDPRKSSGTSTSTFIIGSRSTGLHFLTPSLKAIEPAILKAASEGVGKANSVAKKLRDSIEVAALGWAWLVAHGKEGGNEWHFEQAARDKGGEWARSVSELWAATESLITDDIDDEASSIQAYAEAMEKFRKASGEQEPLPSR